MCATHGHILYRPLHRDVGVGEGNPEHRLGDLCRLGLDWWGDAQASGRVENPVHNGVHERET